MVLYHDDGQVVAEHELRLEKQAKKHAETYGYTDQKEIAEQLSSQPSANEEYVYFIVDEQKFRTLYSKEGGDQTRYETDHKFPDLDLHGGRIARFERQGTQPFPTDGVHKKTLMKCSSLAHEFFSFDPLAKELHLPVKRARRHVANTKTYYDHHHPQMALIRSKPIERYIIPWIDRMRRREEAYEKDKQKTKLPEIALPRRLFSKIHLYNAMVQLDMPKFAQKNLISALCTEMYEKDLSQCELDALEITIGRFNSNAVGILDPVLNFFVGTYALRTLSDRQNHLPSNTREHKRAYMPRFLRYTNRKATPRDDTIIVPPKLPVLGHSIKHWSGLRGDDDAAAARTDFPLNVGKMKKHWRRSSTESIRDEEKDENNVVRYTEWSTYPFHGAD
ncbi:hypothetical protein BDV95DRAFT_562320 [Massariosphaeria phaeospora]|uniref:Uncharacterized protein n=1 Tax=Massariosphaeria phaeospora TaxID=100035 RepID=A0A7C8MS63_9PLEO|nr:hypothetical protein BDV95DRAFT_562320 [Massariosphaeria phaeospora]